VTPDLQELFTAHTTWGTYSSMLRIYKDYTVKGVLYPA
jgi:hypothetical protein